MVRLPLALFLTFFLGIASTSMAQDAKPTSPLRLALVSSTPSENINNLLDLAQAKLSGEPRLEILERKAIQKILAEQKLSLAGLVDSSLAVKAGKLLSADVFALVETDPQGKEALGLVIYDAETGIKWYDQTLATAAVDQQVEAIAQAVRGVAKKRAAGLQGWRTLCILGTRNADLPRSQDHVVSTVAWLLERHLLTSPSLAVLERKRLDWVNKEKNLTGVNKELLASLVLVDVEISRADKGIKATVHLTDSQGKDLGKIKAESKTASAEELTSGLLAGMVQNLQATPAGTFPDRLRESQRFFQEGKRLLSQKHWQPAIQALEAAYALDGAKREIRDELAKTLIGWGEWALPRQSKSLPVQREIPKPEMVKQVLAGGARGYELRMLALENTPARFEDMEKYRSLHTDHGLNFFAASHYPQELIDEEFRELRRQVFAVFVQLANKELERWCQVMGQTTSVWGVGLYTGQLTSFLGEIKNSQFFSVQEQDSIALPWLTRWSEVIQTPGLNVDWQVNSLFQQTFDRDLRFVPIYEKLTRHSSPLIQLWGRYLLINVRRNNGLLTPAQAELAYQECKQKAMEIIEKQPLSSKPLDWYNLRADLRYTCYMFLVQTSHLRNTSNAEARYREKFAICEIMLRRRELVINILLDALYKNPSSKESFPNERLKLIKQAQEVLAQGIPALCENPAFIKGVLARIQEEILRERPDLVQEQPKSATPNAFKEMRLLWRPEEIPNFRGMGPPTVRGDYIFVPVHRREHPQDPSSENLLEVLQVPWKQKGTLKKWGQWKLPARLPGERSTFGILSCCWCEDRLFVGTQFGLFAFAQDGTVQSVHKDFDLPVLATQAMAYHEGKLYAYQQGGYFVALDLKTKKYETLASSRRRERLSPFDDSDVFHIHGLVVDPPRDRLLIVLSQRPSVMEFYPAGKYPDSTNGLWEYNCKTKKFARIVELYYRRLTDISALEPGHLLLSSAGVVDFDIKTQQAEILFIPGKMGPSLTRLDAPLIQPAAVLHPDFKYFWKHDGHLWAVASYYLAKISLQDGRIEILPGFGTPFSRPMTYIWRALERIPPNRLVMQNKTGLWLLELPE